MKLEECEVTHRRRSSCTIRKRRGSEWRRRRKNHRRAQSLHVLKSHIQLLVFGLLCLLKLSLHHLPPGLPLRLLLLLLCLELCLELSLHLGLQYVIKWLEFKTNIFNNQGTTNETEITFSSAICISVVLGRGRMAGLELVLLARICARVGVLAVSITLSPIQYRPCFLPPPTLMMISPSMGAVLGSNSGPWTSVAIELN